MYTPPAISPQETPRSESQASEDEEDEDDISPAEQLGYQPNDPEFPAAVDARETSAGDEEEEPSLVIPASNLDGFQQYREIAHGSAVCWELSSSKPGNGVEQLRDSSTDTYWQSDGTTQPHWVQITFRRRLPVVYVALYLDFQLDESYTPKTLSIETGMTAQDLYAAPQNRKIELTDPVGWSVIAVHGPPDALAEHETVKTHMIRINILSMHQNGRDTHIRRLAVFAKRTRPPLLQVASSNLRGDSNNANEPSIMNGDDEDDANLMLSSVQPFSMSIR